MPAAGFRAGQLACGATLTSLAIAESVAWRLSLPWGGQDAAPPTLPPSRRFEDLPAVDERQDWFAEARRVEPREGRPVAAPVVVGAVGYLHGAGRFVSQRRRLGLLLWISR